MLLFFSVKALLDKGADPNLKDILGNTPLHLGINTVVLVICNYIYKDEVQKICKIKLHKFGILQFLYKSFLLLFLKEATEI
jgi:hypothetical protein